MSQRPIPGQSKAALGAAVPDGGVDAWSRGGTETGYRGARTGSPGYTLGEAYNLTKTVPRSWKMTLPPAKSRARCAGLIVTYSEP